MPKELPVGRKYLLMLRDPLVEKLNEKHKEWRKNCFDEILTLEVEQLKKKVQDKWNARLHWPETTLQGVTDYWLAVIPPHIAVRDGSDNAKREEHLFINKETGKMTFLKCKGLVSCSPHETPIFINDAILTLHDAQKVQEAAWNIVKTKIEKRKKTIMGRDIPDDLTDMLPPDYKEQEKPIKGRDFAVPAEEPEALAPILRCRQETFDNYLRWYDQWLRGLDFRRITYVELTITDPAKREELFQKYAEARRPPITITSSMPADLRRTITAKENAVRKGVDLIYYAIHRKNRTTDNPLEEIIRVPQSSRPHKCTHSARTCLMDCPSPKDCSSYQELLQLCQTS
ncbi:MAG: hypothetical protein FJ135_15135 [Deltaproteobacteria bacterium]|nr:hypothetical protein [Deltaproteobacteria bacterium]